MLALVEEHVFAAKRKLLAEWKADPIVGQQEALGLFVAGEHHAEEVPNFILSEIERQLKDQYAIDIYSDSVARHALRQDLKDFRESARGQLLANRETEYRVAEVDFIESITGDRPKYFGRLMRFLR